jgi:hypothetical protein
MADQLDHERERRAAIDQDGIQRTSEQAERQEILNGQGIRERCQHVRIDQGSDGE